MKDSIVEAVQKDLQERSERGINKYGVTLDRTDLTHLEWMNHHYEELLDAALYVKRQIKDLQKLTIKPAEYDNKPCCQTGCASGCTEFQSKEKVFTTTVEDFNSLNKWQVEIGLNSTPEKQFRYPKNL